MGLCTCRVIRIETSSRGNRIEARWKLQLPCYFSTVERRLSERQPSETSNIRTHIFFVLRSNNEKSTITSRNKVLCHFYLVLFFVCTVLHCNGNIILEKPLDFMHCVASRFGYPSCRWSQLVRIIDVLLYNKGEIVWTCSMYGEKK